MLGTAQIEDTLDIRDLLHRLVFHRVSHSRSDDRFVFRVSGSFRDLLDFQGVIRESSPNVSFAISAARRGDTSRLVGWLSGSANDLFSYLLIGGDRINLRYPA